MTQALTVRVTATEGPYRPVPVEVPPGTTRIDVAMAYAKAGDCIIDLGLMDPRATAFPSPAGFRGWSGGARDSFFVATDDATPGYVPGPIPAGTWTILLGLYRVPPGGAEVALTIRLDDAPRPAWSPEPAADVRVPAPGWYRGDLHCHTHHSDARGGPELLHEAARQAGLRFLAVTDHNTTTQRRYFSPRSSPDLVFIRGEEVTTAEGHANVFGAESWIDFRMTAPADAHLLAEAVRRAGGLLSINHDKPPIPWRHELPAVDCMEAWQSHWFAGNWISLARYDARLRQGRRISLIGGSDWHQPAALAPPGPPPRRGRSASAGRPPYCGCRSCRRRRCCGRCAPATAMSPRGRTGRISPSPPAACRWAAPIPAAPTGPSRRRSAAPPATGWSGSMPAALSPSRRSRRRTGSPG